MIDSEAPTLPATPTETDTVKTALATTNSISEVRRIMGRAKDIEEEARAVRTRLAAIDATAGDIETLRDLGAEWAAIRIEAAAKGAEIVDRSQANGEVKRAGGDQRSLLRATTMKLSDLGIERTELHRWRAVAGVGYDDRQKYYEWAKTQDGREGEITMAGLLRFVKVPEPVVEPIALPAGKYRCIVIDPPWPMEKIERDVRVRQGRDLDYPIMSLEQIADIAVPTVAYEEGCHVYLWVTHRFLPTGLRLFEHWGVTYQCVMTWVKNVGITPFSWMYDTEHVLFGRVGSLQLEQLGLRLSFNADVTHHSAKPSVFYERVLAASPEPRLEMFQREPRDGFEGWGNEVADSSNNE